MDREYLVSSSETLYTADPEIKWNQNALPVVKEELENNIDDENSPGSDYMMSPQHVNYYDSKSHVLEEVKEELPGDEYREADCTVDNKVFPENNILVDVKDKQRLENVNTELSLDIKEENEDKIYELTIKLEADDEKEMLDNAEGTSVHYEVSVTPPGSQYKLCDKTFKNSSNILKQNSEHTKKNHTSRDNKVCQYCDENFNSRDDMLAHVSDVHKKICPKCELCGKQFKKEQGLKCHMLAIHKLKKPRKLVIRKNMKCTYCDLDFKNKLYFRSHMKRCHPPNDVTYQCDMCMKILKTRDSLVSHIKRSHYDFGRTFECWCGEKFHTPKHLSEHRGLQHNTTKKYEYKCKDCDKVFSSKQCLKTHIRKCRCEYESDCVSELRTPINSIEQKSQRHNRESDAKNQRVQCDRCHRTFTNNTYLTTHKKLVHYDYDEVFKCWCGQEFYTPYQLKRHKSMHDYINTKVQCDKCQKFYINRDSLVRHKVKYHGDYGRVYKCWCGKEFRTPSELADHNRQQHDSKTECANNDKYQCVTCMGIFKTRKYLLNHMRRVHYDYGDRVYVCWCGKVFRTPYKLSNHKYMVHDSNKNETVIAKVQCDVCKRFYKSNRLLELHCKKVHCEYLLE